MSNFKIGDKIEGKDEKGTLVCGSIVKVNKNTYKLEKGVLVSKETATEPNVEYWDSVVAKKLRNACILSIKGTHLENLTDAALKRAAAAILGKKAVTELEDIIKKRLGL